MSVMQLYGNVNGMALDKVPAQTLQQLVMQPGPQQTVALIELKRRKDMQQAGSLPQAQAQAQQPSVAQQLMQGQPGLPGQPTGSAIPKQYAQGGIVAFQQGGRTFDPTQGTVMDRRPTTLTDLIRSFQTQQQAIAQRSADTLYGPGWNYNVPPPSPHPVAGLANANNAARRADMIRVPDAYPPHTMTDDRRGGGGASWGEPAPYSNEGRPSAISEMNRNAQLLQQPPLPGTGGGAGVAGLARRRGSDYPEWVDPRVGAPSARMSDEEFDAELVKQKERLEKLYGKDIAEDMIAEIKAERDKLPKKYEDNKNEAIMRAGLAMLGGRSKWGAVNIGEGGLKGLDAYQQGKSAIDKDATALRREQQHAMLGQQARKDAILGQSLGRADQANNARAAERAEHIGVMKDWYESRVGKANFGLKEQQLDIEMAKVRVDADRNSIMRDSSKMDVVARISQQAQENALKIVEEDAQRNPMSPWAKLSPQERFAASQTMAQRWIDNNIGVRSITGRAGAMPARISWDK